MSDENLFGLQATEIGIQYHVSLPERYNKHRTDGPPFEQVLQILAEREVEAYFLRWSDTEHKITIPWPEGEGQLELVVEWLPQVFYYDLKANRKKKTSFQAYQKFPEEKRRERS